MCNSMFWWTEHHFSRPITLETHGIFGPNFAYLFILTLSSHWYAEWWRGYASFWSVENAHNSWKAPYRWSNFAYLYICFWNRQGKWQTKENNIKKKYWSRLGSNPCASGFWVTRMPLRLNGHHVLNTILEQFTHIPFTYVRQIKIERPWYRILINLRSPWVMHIAVSWFFHSSVWIKVLFSFVWELRKITCIPCASSREHGRIQRGAGGPENHRYIGFISNTGPDPLKNHKASMQFWQHRPASNTPYGVSLAGPWWPIYSGIWILYPIIN